MKKIILYYSLAVLIAFTCSSSVSGKAKIKTIKYSSKVVYRGYAEKKTPMGYGELFVSSSPTILKDGLDSAPFDRIEGDFDNQSISNGILTFSEGIVFSGDIDLTITEKTVVYKLSNGYFQRYKWAHFDSFYDAYEISDMNGNTIKSKTSPKDYEMELPVSKPISITREFFGSGFESSIANVEVESSEIIEKPDLRYITDNTRPYASSFAFAGNSSGDLRVTRLMNVSVLNYEASNSKENDFATWTFQNGCNGTYEKKGEASIIVLDNGNDHFERTGTTEEATVQFSKQLGNNDCTVTYSGSEFKYYSYNQYEYLTDILKEYITVEEAERINQVKRNSEKVKLKIRNDSYPSRYEIFRYSDGSRFIGELQDYSFINLLLLDHSPKKEEYGCGVFFTPDGVKEIYINGRSGWTLSSLESRINKEEEKIREEEERVAREEREQKEWLESLAKKYGKENFEKLYYDQKIEVGMPEGLVLDLIKNVKLWNEDTQFRVYRVYNDWGNYWLKTIWVDKKTKKIIDVTNHD